MLIKKFVCGYLKENGYVIYHEDSKIGYIIDPGYRPKLYLDFIEENNLDIRGILLTHNHRDHIGAVKGIKEVKNILAYMHPSDSKYVTKFDAVDIAEGDTFDFGDSEFKVLETPGHSPGGVMYINEKENLIFTGDTIFSHEIGETRFEGGNSHDMANTLFRIENLLPDDILIYPGHGGRTTMGNLRKENLEYQEGLKYYHSLKESMNA